MIMRLFLLCFLVFGVLGADVLRKDQKNGVTLSLGLMGFGVSYFDYYRNSEFYGMYSSFSDNNYDESYLNIHYRKFLKDQIGGWYYGGFGQHVEIDGKLKNEHKNAKQNKFGIGGEIGYSYFGLFNYPGLYINSGLGLGVYLSSENEIFEEEGLFGDQPMVIHFDLFRIGFVF